MVACPALAVHVFQLDQLPYFSVSCHSKSSFFVHLVLSFVLSFLFLIPFLESIVMSFFLTFRYTLYSICLSLPVSSLSVLIYRYFSVCSSTIHLFLYLYLSIPYSFRLISSILYYISSSVSPLVSLFLSLFPHYLSLYS